MDRELFQEIDIASLQTTSDATASFSFKLT
jgi:hypothetical protein